MRWALLLVGLLACTSPQRPADEPVASATPTASTTQPVEPALVESAPQPTAASSAISPPSPSAPPPPAPLKLSRDQAQACAAELAAKLKPSLTLRQVDGASPMAHWFEVEQAPIAVVVGDSDCSAAFAANVGDERRLDTGTAKRFVRQRAAARRVLEADDEYRALCKRLEALKSQHANLRGCIAWLEQFPADLCTTTAPECQWQYYVGERMDTHTNRHFTLAIDPTRRQVVAATDTMGHATPGAVWRRAPALRGALQARLAREPAIQARCQSLADCPAVPRIGSLCTGERCFELRLPRGVGDAELWNIETDAAGVPKTVYDFDDHVLAYKAWLAQLGAK